MKPLFILLLSVCLVSVAKAQSVPQGMQYQAIARNLKGDILANEPVSLKISLISQAGSSDVYYTETHSVTTNSLGLFTLVIGEGKVEKGAFNSIPWSTQNIWLQIAIKDKGQVNFTTINNSKLLAVPYAFYAETTSKVTSTTQAAVAGPNNSNPCGCQEGLSSMTILYLGNNGVNINLYSDSKLKAGDLLQTFANVQNGAILTINPVGNDKKIKDNLFFQLGGSAVQISGKCNDEVIGQTYGNFSVVSRTDVKNKLTCSVCDVQQNWKIGGNVVATPCNWLGSLSNSDLILITNNIPRIVVAADGNTTITNTTQSTAPANGALMVNGGVGVAKNLNVGGIANIKNTTQSTNSSDGALVVDGGVGIKGNLNVDGTTSFGSVGTNTLTTKGLNVINDTATFLATFQNTNGGEGDGINIKLGRAKTFYAPPDLPNLNANFFNQVKDLIDNNYIANKVAQFGNIIKDGAIETGKVLAGLAVGAGNMIIDVINDKLSLPYKIGPYSTPDIHIWDETTVFGGLTMPPGVPNIPSISIPALDIPSKEVLPRVTVMPKLPEIDLTSIGIDAIDFTNIDFWSIPSFDLNDIPGFNPLNNSNEFIRFTDKNDVKMGSIKAASLKDFSDNYLNPIFLYKIYGAITSSMVDKYHALYHFKSEMFKVMKDYYYLGVEYSSGNGDYAEWLPRKDKSETIGAGDIVGVTAGKITKDLKDAEQVMVVSHNPIILGNIPVEGKNHEGNNIAFMGQVPVKILGPVTTGDYIIGQSNTPGYGIAKHPNKMTIEDFKNAVGRSWVTDETDIPKMVNTVVGVHNNSFLNIIKELKQSTEENDARLKALENKLNMPVIKSKITKKQPLN